MNAMVRQPDPQLHLSILFLALADGARQQESRRSCTHVEQRADCDALTLNRELAAEDPERWDGLW